MTDDWTGYVAPPGGAALATARIGDPLRRLAADPAFAARQLQLTEVATALDGGPDAALWAEMDLLRVLDVDGPMVGVSPESSRARQLEMLRTFLIFCPLIVTWVGLYLASRAYGALIASDSDAGRLPFLKLWLDGFHHRTAFSLDRMALASATLIGLLVLVSVLLERQRQADDLGYESLMEQKRQQLRSCAIHAQVGLAKHRLSTPERFRAEITKSSAAFGKVVDKINTITEVITSSLSELGMVASKLESASQLSSTGAVEIAQASGRLSEQVSSLDGTLASTAVALEGAVRQNGDQLARQVATSTDAVERAVRDTSQALGKHVETSAGWVVGAAEALLSQSDAALAASEEAYDKVNRAHVSMQERVDAAVKREVGAQQLLEATQATTAEVGATRNAIAALAGALQQLPFQRGDAVEDRLLRAAQALEATAARLGQLVSAPSLDR